MKSLSFGQNCNLDCSKTLWAALQRFESILLLVNCFVSKILEPRKKVMSGNSQMLQTGLDGFRVAQSVLEQRWWWGQPTNTQASLRCFALKHFKQITIFTVPHFKKIPSGQVIRVRSFYEFVLYFSWKWCQFFPCTLLTAQTPAT